MEIQIKTSGVSGAKKFRGIAARHICAAIGRVGHIVQSVSVRLSDMQKPRGVADKLCRVVIQMKGRFVVLEELGPDMARVIERAAIRVQTTIAGQGGARRPIGATQPA